MAFAGIKFIWMTFFKLLPAECVLAVRSDIIVECRALAGFRVANCATDMITEAPFCTEGAVSSMIQPMGPCLANIESTRLYVLYTVDDSANTGKVVKNLRRHDTLRKDWDWGSVKFTDN